MLQQSQYAQRRKPRVLVAEDCLDTQALLSLILELSGVEVTVASDGEDCLSLVFEAKHSEKPFDLVFMDIAMPKLDGHLTTKQLRKSGCYMPIIAMTSASSLAQRNSSIHAGCTSFLAKSTIRETIVPTVQLYFPHDC